MPKNAVQRLQKIEDDLKTVIHIYDFADKYKNEYDTLEEPENECTRQSSLHNLFKKTLGLDTQCLQGVQFRKSRLMAKKPESAPSSPPSALFTICESDYIGQTSSEFTNNADGRENLTKKRSFKNLLNLSNEFNSSNISFHELFMTPSKTLQTAHEILAENKYTEDTEVEGTCEPLYSESITCFEEKDREDRSKLKNQDARRNVNNSHSLKYNSELNFIRQREELKNESAIERSRSVPSRKESPVQKEFQEISAKHSMISKKILELDSPRFNITEEKSSIKLRDEITNSQEKADKHGRSKTEKNDLSRKKVASDARKNKHLKEGKSKAFGKKSSKEKQETKVKFPESPSDCKNQKKTCKTENVELWEKEVPQGTEISHEKLEKMKFSKELALDIAKHLKNKYDEVLESKKKLMETGQKLEKENEKLNREIKETQQSKMKLQLKIEGLKKSSRTKLTEHSIKTKSTLDENIYLKTKMCEIEKQFNEELLKKQKEIDQIQKERLFDIKNELKSREDQEEDIQRLMKEKSELQYLLNEQYSKNIILEEKIRQLQEEIQKQKQHLKKKTERLEETNKELESIRQNSKDLEEQVKTLRKNIEKFDEIQTNLMKQTAAYDQQIKSNQELIKKFQDENSKLKTELEKEKDGQLIKSKIIEDQQGTIQKMKEKSEEAKALVKKNQSLERILNIEREEKLELQHALEHLKCRKEELKKKINSLESDDLTPKEVIRDLKKTQNVLHELENQVQIKQKEWELQLQSAMREKDQACSVAEFATRKLMQITKEFQKQSQAHERLQVILAENLAEKEKHGTNRKVTLAQSGQSLSCALLDENTSCSKSRQHSSNDVLMNWYFKNSSNCHENIEPKSSLPLP